MTPDDGQTGSYSGPQVRFEEVHELLKSVRDLISSNRFSITIRKLSRDPRIEMPSTATSVCSFL
jgi:hypothetical protein